MSGQKKFALSDALSLPLSTLEGMADSELQSIATEAGVSVAKLREILARARQRYEELAANQQAIAQADEERNRKYRYVPEFLRITIARMEATPDQLNEADRLEMAAYQLLEDPAKASEAYGAFFSSQMILARHRFASLCQQETDIVYAINALWAEKQLESEQRANIPSYRKATWESFLTVRKELLRYSDRSPRMRPEVDGPAEKFSTDIVLNFPRNPRPRRYNDDLEPF